MAYYGKGATGQVLTDKTAPNMSLFSSISSSGAITTINSEPPSSGNFNILGTSNQIAVTPAAGQDTLSLIGPYTPSTFTTNGVLYGNTTSSIGVTAQGGANTVLLGNGGVPSFGTVPNAALTNSSVTLNNGNNITVTGSPLSLGGTASFNLTGTTTNAIQVGNASGNLTSLGVVNNGVLITSATGIPSLLPDGITGQVFTATTGSPPSWANPATSGTVTSVTGTANQVAVATGTTTPVISLIGPYTPSTYPSNQLLFGNGTSSLQTNANLTFTPSTNTLFTFNGQFKGPDPWADVTAWGADPTGSADSTTAIQNAINSFNNTIQGGTVFFPAGTYKISSTLTVTVHSLTLLGVGSGYNNDVSTFSMGSSLSWAGPSNTTASIMIKAFPPSTGTTAPGLKAFRMLGLSLYGNGTALIGLQMISCQGLHVEDFYIQDTAYVGLDMNVLNDSQTDAGERDITRGEIRRGNIRTLDGQLSTATSTLANATNVGAFSGAGTITTSTTITSGSANGQFPASGVILLWVLDPNGHYQQAAFSYTSLTTGASGSFNGVTSLGMLTNTSGFSPLGSLTPVLSSSTLTGLTTIQLAQGPASMGIRLDGAPLFDVAYIDFEMIQINQGNSVGISCFNTDDNYFYDIIVNRSAGATLTPPGVTLHGSTVSANYVSRNNSFYGGSSGVGGVVAYGTAQGTISTSQNNFGAIVYTNPSIDTYWHDYGMANGEPQPGLGLFAWFWFNNNSTQFGAPYNKILGNSFNGGITAISAASSGINTETIVTAQTTVPFNAMQLGTSYRITLLGTCTSTVANTSTFTIRMGTLGTISDASIASATTVVAATTGTAIPFRAIIEFTVRATGTTGSIAGTLTLFNAGATGISTVLTQVISLAATATMNTTVNSYIEVTYKAAAAGTTCTFNNAIIEVVKA